MNVSGSSAAPDMDRAGGAIPRIRARYLAVAAMVVGIVLIVAALAALRIVQIGTSATGLAGAVIDPPMPATDFTLHDQFDTPISLSSFRGKVVVLTFLYTHCPDACPLITEKLHQAYELLGPDASRLAILAVTVDPNRDTIQQVRQYSAEKDMLNKWHFLVGPMADVKPVWNAYGVSAALDDLASGQANAAAVVTPTPVSGNGYIVDHAAPIYVIDRNGQARAILDVDFAPSDLVHDVRALLN